MHHSNKSFDIWLTELSSKPLMVAKFNPGQTTRRSSDEHTDNADPQDRQIGCRSIRIQVAPPQKKGNALQKSVWGKVPPCFITVGLSAGLAFVSLEPSRKEAVFFSRPKGRTCSIPGSASRCCCCSRPDRPTPGVETKIVPSKKTHE